MKKDVYELYRRVIKELEVRGIEYHITPCDGYNQVIVYPEDYEYVVLLNRDDETGECEFFPEHYDFDDIIQPYLFVKDIGGASK